MKIYLPILLILVGCSGAFYSDAPPSRPCPPGLLADGSGGVVVGGKISTALSPANVVYYGAVTGSGDDTAAITAAAMAVGTAGGGDVFFPAGVYSFTAPVATRVDVDEGAALQLTSGYSKIRFIGEKGTIFKPASNEIEMFAINGATDIVFENIIFDNSDNGVLQNQTKQSTKTINGGVAGLGNGANAAIRQYAGANLTVKNCTFIDFNVAVDYIGDNSNEATLSGDLVVENTFFDGCVFGLLTQQPETIRFVGNRGDSLVDSTNADTSVDPGHMLYVSNRDGGVPRSIIVNDIRDYNSNSYAIQVRKGENVSISNFAINDAGRGIEVQGVDNLSLGPGSIKLSSTLTGSNRCGLGLYDIGPAVVSDIVVDIRGVDAWGIEIAESLGASGAADYDNKYIKIVDCTVINDYSGATGKAPMLINAVSDITVEGFTFVHPGSTAGSRMPIDARDVDNGRFIRPVHKNPDGAADADHLVSLDADCTGCYIEYSPNDQDGTINSGSVVDNAGTNTISPIHPTGLVEISSSDTYTGLDVSNVDVVKVATSSNTVTISGLTGGNYVGKQVMFYKPSTSNNFTIEHAEGDGNQDIYTADGSDLTIASRGGVTIVYNGSGAWIVQSTAP